MICSTEITQNLTFLLQQSHCNIIVGQSLVEVLFGLRHRDPREGQVTLHNLWCHLAVCLTILLRYLGRGEKKKRKKEIGCHWSTLWLFLSKILKQGKHIPLLSPTEMKMNSIMMDICHIIHCFLFFVVLTKSCKLRRPRELHMDLFFSSLKTKKILGSSPSDKLFEDETLLQTKW